MLALGHEPDAVIALDGYNELAIASENARRGAHPLFPSWFEMLNLLRGGITDPRAVDAWLEMETQRREAQRLFEIARSWRLTRSAVLGRLLEVRQARRTAGALDALARYRDEIGGQPFPLPVEGPPYTPAPEQLPTDLVRAWKEGVRGLQALCRARGIHFLEVLQPSRDDLGSKPLAPRERLGEGNPVWAEDVRRGYPLLRAAGSELAREGVNFLDATRVFEEVDAEIYLDGCHFEREGYELLSRLVAPAFLATMPADRAMESR